MLTLELPADTLEANSSRRPANFSVHLSAKKSSLRAAVGVVLRAPVYLAQGVAEPFPLASSR